MQEGLEEGDGLRKRKFIGGLGVSFDRASEELVGGNGRRTCWRSSRDERVERLSGVLLERPQDDFRLANADAGGATVQRRIFGLARERGGGGRGGTRGRTESALIFLSVRSSGVPTMRIICVSWSLLSLPLKSG